MVRLVSRTRSLIVRGLGDPVVLIALGAGAALAYLAVVPIFLIALRSLQTGTGPIGEVLTFDNFIAAYSSPYTYSTFTNSLLFAAGASATSFVIGTTLAWLVQRTDLPGRRIVVVLLLVPLILPGVIEAIAWIFLLGPNGYLNVALRELTGSGPFSIFTLPGMIWVQALSQVPLVFLLMSAAFRGMDPSLEESAAMSGAGATRVFRRITMPLLLPTSASVVLLMFINAIEAFEIPALIGIPARTFVYTSEIYIAFRDFPTDYGLAAALSMGLLIISMIGVATYLYLVRRRSSFQTITGKAFRPRRVSLGRARWIALSVVAVYFVFAAVLPLSIVVWTSLFPFLAALDTESLRLISLDNYATLIGLNEFRTALQNSVVLALSAATATTCLAAIVAWLVYRSKLPFSRLLDFLAFLPIGVPGIVLAVGVLTAYVLLPIPIYGTLAILFLAYVTKFIPYGMRSAAGSIQQIHTELEEAARMSGGGWWRTFRLITVPLILPGLAAAWIYILIVSFREFSTSVLLANADTTVMSVFLFNTFERGRPGIVSAAAVVMMVVLLVTIALFYKLTGKTGLQE